MNDVLGPVIREQGVRDWQRLFCRAFPGGAVRQ